jgi:hypothetical protein
VNTLLGLLGFGVFIMCMGTLWCDPQWLHATHQPHHPKMAVQPTITPRWEQAQIQITHLEHQIWATKPIDWYGHDNCHICGIYANPPRPTLPDPGWKR